MAVLDDVYGDAPNAIDRVYEPAPTAALDDVFGADDAPPSGSAIDDVFGDDEGEIKNAPASWGDVLGFFGKMGSGPMAVDERALDFIAKGGLEGGAKAPEILTPQEKEAALGTVVPAGIVGGSLLVGGPGAGLAAREALGLTTGALSRAAIAKSRDQDMTDAVFDPSGIAIDATLSATPEIWAGAKAVGRGIKAVTPEVVAGPVRAAAGAVRDRAGAALSSLADRIAQRYPRYAARILDPTDLAPSLRSVVSDRPDIPWDEAALATEPLQGAGNAAGARPSSVIRENLWSHASRDLLQSDDPVVRTAGLMVRKAGRLDRSFAQVAGHRLESVLGGVNASQSADVADALEQGISRFTTPPEIAAQARPVRDLLHEVGDLRRSYVYDDISKTHALELLDANEATPWAKTPVTTVGEGRQYRPALDADFYYPRKTPTPDDTGLLQTATERIIERDPELSARAAQHRLHQMRTGNTSGWSRAFDDAGDAADGFEYTRELHDAVPRYVRTAGRQVVNGAVFGAKPVKLTIETGAGPVSMTVGERAAQAYDHMLNTRQYEQARLFGNALLERYAPDTISTSDPRVTDLLRSATRKTSDMALSHTWLTQTGQIPTAAWASGGSHQLARGLSMVEHNPELRALFAAGPQKASFTDFLAEARGGVPAEGMPTPMRMMEGIENWLRGPGSYAAVASLDDIAQEAAAVRAAGGQYSRALIRRAAEAGTTPEALATELAQNGRLSQGTWLDGIQSLTDRWQYTAGPGELPHGLKTPAGQAALQWRSFSVKSAQHVIDDIVGVLREGYRTGDQSLIDLGKQRLRTFALTSMPGNAATSALKSVARGRAPSLLNMGEAMFKGPMGIAGDAAMLPVDLATARYDQHPVERFGEVPMVSVPAGALEDVARGLRTGQPLVAAKGAATLGGAYDPRIPLYGALPLGLAHSLTKD